MVDTAVNVAKFLVDLLVLAVVVGYWAGERRKRAPAPPATSVTRVDEGNGQPTLWETTRRVEALEERLDGYVTRDVAAAKFEGLSREIRNQRELTDALRRNVEGLMGQG